MARARLSSESNSFASCVWIVTASARATSGEASVPLESSIARSNACGRATLALPPGPADHLIGNQEGVNRSIVKALVQLQGPVYQSFHGRDCPASAGCLSTGRSSNPMLPLSNRAGRHLISSRCRRLPLDSSVNFSQIRVLHFQTAQAIPLSAQIETPRSRRSTSAAAKSVGSISSPSSCTKA